MTDSEAAGIPLKPSSVLTRPSCMTPLPVRCASSACWMTGMRKSVEYSSARRISSAFMTGWPSSEMATQPAPINSPISASSSPRCPLVMAPMGKTWAAPSRRARSMMKSVTDWLSLTGAVLAIQQTDVNPPRAAARVPVAIVSMSSRPGSRRWTCRSTKPGQTTLPRASRTRSADGAGCTPGLATSAIRPSSINRFNTASRRFAGSITRPPAIRILIVSPFDGPGSGSTHAAADREPRPALGAVTK